MISSTFSAKAGSLERLKVRSRWGWRLCAFQMRCTVVSDKLAALAMARPVQWVTSPGGSVQLSATISATLDRGHRRLARLAASVAQQPLNPALA